MMRYPDTRWLWQEGMSRQEISHCLFRKMQQHHALPLLLRHECYINGLDTGLHHHVDFYAFYIVQSGQGIHLIDHHPYTIVRGDVYILPPGTIHAYQHYHTLEIDAFYFQRQLFSMEDLAALRALPGFWRLLIGTEDTSSEKNISCAHRLHLSPERHREVNKMIAETCVEYIEKDAASALLTHNQLFRLLVSIARQQRSADKKTAVPKSEWDITCSTDIANILRICEERFQEPLTVPQLASLLFLSPSRFSEIFTREVGVSPAAYIRRLRLEHAQMLLRTTSLSITEIAYQAGFGDGPHLARAFKAALHFTPTSYRAAFGQADFGGLRAAQLPMGH
jgi:AraC-like DNA-binding protein/mannose-6-phosphate isomerase-like protein (cupin superfamily)